MALAHKDRERLRALLAMFSSTFDGEVVNAARAAERLIKSSGESWDSVLASPLRIADDRPRSNEYTWQPPRHKPQPREQSEPDHAAEIMACLEKSNLLTAWEIEFLTSAVDRRHLSEKQQAILDRIKAKLKGFDGMSW